MKNEDNRLEFIDALRGIAALLVFVCHLRALMYNNILSKHASLWADMGNTGVFLFFIISAYSLSLTMPRHQNTNHPFISFYFHRIFRIIPLFWSILLVSCLYHILKGYKIILFDFILNALCLFNFYIPIPEGVYVAGGWTISVEMIFYLIFPFIYIYINTLKKHLIFLFFSIIFFFILRYIMRFVLFPQYPNYMNWSIIHYLPFFISGMLAYQLCTNSKIFIKNQYFFGFILVIVAIIFIICYTYKLLQITDGYFLWSIDDQYLLIIGYFLLIIGLKYCPIKLFVNKFTIFLGKISFSIYLMHPFFIIILKRPITNLFFKLNLHHDLNFIILFIIIFFQLIYFSYLSYKLIEKPGIKYGKKFLSNFFNVRYLNQS
jgi:peptidoglycan/LPS O-acetylase OafA/YrhL